MADLLRLELEDDILWFCCELPALLEALLMPIAAWAGMPGPALVIIVINCPVDSKSIAIRLLYLYWDMIQILD